MAPTPESNLTDLVVRGALPSGLSGRLLGIGSEPGVDGGVVHSIDLDAGRCISYRNWRVVTDAVASNFIHFGGSILALGEGTVAYELASDLGTLRRVDLAGQHRGLSAYPKRDPITGDLHLLAVAADGAQAHVIVSSGALTRASRPIIGAPGLVRDLALTRDRVVFVTDGFVGVASREGDAHITWVGTGIDAPCLVHAHDAGDTIVVHTLTPSLERWTLDIASAAVHRGVLDPTPRRFARTSDRPVDAAPRFLWTTGDGTADKHDLATTSCLHHIFEPHRLPGDLVFVADTARPSDADGGWLVGFVQHASRDETDIVVLDAADIARPAIATVRIPRRIPLGLRSTWIPSLESPLTRRPCA